MAMLPWLGAAWLRLVNRSIRWKWIGREIVDDAITERATFIIAFWHGRILMMAPVMEQSARPIHVVISANRDGEFIARVIGYFGGQALRGSTRDPRKRRGKAGDAVMRGALGILEQGDLVAITPDGPRGPRMCAQPGVAALSAKTGLPVIPFAWATKRARMLHRWDRFMLAWPFDRGVYVIGSPVMPQGDDKHAIEQHRLAIETALNSVTRQADEHVGRVPVDPS